MPMSLELARGILDAWNREADDLRRSLQFCTDERQLRGAVDQIDRLTKASELFTRDVLAWWEEDKARRRAERN